MKRFISYALIGFTLFTIGCNTTYRQANKHYRNFQYNDAAIKYKEYLKDHTKPLIDYLIGKGIDKERLAPGWYGERQPLNECVDDIICTPPKHQQNRRTQFKVRILETDN
ncbi:MAG: hypothetical protein H3C54_01485 [Taibaiella sp.]|nr:hypothetical protein [Taibaiella sp.]